jgi:hypothetical protein
MENLTKHQIVLLTLLISFVTSMATGIVSVALMNQAPAGVTQTINRVVQTTVEKIIPQASTSTPNSTPGQIIKETVVVSSDNAVTDAVATNTASVIRIYRTNSDPSLGLSSMTLVGIGMSVTDDGIIATDQSIISSDSGKYFVSDGNGKLLPLDILRSVSGEHVALLRIRQGDSTLVLPKVALANADIKLGQAVVSLGGDVKNIVATGIVSSLGTKTIMASSSAASSTAVASIETSISSNSLVPGSLLINLSGEIVGIKATYLDRAEGDLFAPASDIQKALSYVSTSTTSQ